MTPCGPPPLETGGGVIVNASKDGRALAVLSFGGVYVGNGSASACRSRGRCDYPPIGGQLESDVHHHILDGRDRFEAGDVRQIDDERGARFVTAGWATADEQPVPAVAGDVALNVQA